MAKNKKSESVTDKRWRLEQIREQMTEFEQWFHPAPDEVAHLLYLAREWAKLDDLGLSEKELAGIGDNSVFPPLIRFCKDELGKIVKYCESCRSSGKGTLRDCDIQTIKQLCLATDPETVEELCLCLDYVDIAGVLARIMRTCYRALSNPGTLDDLSISELRGDLLEVVAGTYADMNTVIRESAAQNITQGLNQVKYTELASKKVSTIANEMKARAEILSTKHPNSSTSYIASLLHNEFPAVAFHTIRKYDWLKKLTNP